MCGIVGYVGKRDVLPVLLGGLQKLEYRGYDLSLIHIFLRQIILNRASVPATSMNAAATLIIIFPALAMRQRLSVGMRREKRDLLREHMEELNM